MAKSPRHKRRLVRSLAVSVLALSGCAGAADDDAAPVQEESNRQTVQVGYTAPLEEIEAAEATGFDYIELRTSELATLSDPEFEEAVRRIERLNIPTPVSNYFVPGDVRLTGPAVSLERQMEYVRGAMDRMARLGVEYIVFGSGAARSYPDGFSREEAFSQLVDFGKRIAPEAQDHRITVLVEPLRRQESNIVNSAREGLMLVQAVDHPNFQLMVDFFHLAIEQEDPAIIEEASEYIHHLHMANPEGRVFPRSWDEEEAYAPFFTALRAAGYDERISIEASTQDIGTDGPMSIRMMREGFDPSFPLY